MRRRADLFDSGSPMKSKGYGGGVAPEVEVFETSDGSMTLVDVARGVHYRSRHGAVQESRHVFVEGSGLVGRAGTWRVLELGFGAAVNLVETVRAFRESEAATRLVYHTVDWRPVGPEALTFHEGEGGELARAAAAAAQGRAGEAVRVMSDDGCIEVVLHAMAWEEVRLGEEERVDAVYHDPFAKEVNPEAWTMASFAWSLASAAPHGRLATYSAATAVRKAMEEAGWMVWRAKGPGRKREMTVATRSDEPLELPGSKRWGQG
ncbi:tRNA (5-methylaminomethyl-2-thiouridine)(34)-methyltransferase MnmD [Lujinxingia vulgaris]|uniref:tRNA (5-methylaminomethyl-2-thiouridine)(34)-methyltransferase MnmD n=1 Tax=Lujinxingia vulgaris TaxID=2600176 RepID=A0A5C6X7H5_9DELT|nr:tRNA (5-methylaminomethyl-2-thiouridine)(34)-methyltransferase MnmD [Lujinxingia vulgaris]